MRTGEMRPEVVNTISHRVNLGVNIAHIPKGLGKTSAEASLWRPSPQNFNRTLLGIASVHCIPTSALTMYPTSCVRHRLTPIYST